MRTVREKGPRRAIDLLWNVTLDVSWDFMHGTETLARIDPRNIETDSSNKARATTYGATRARPLVKLLGCLGLPREGSFVDLGSGKGRVLLIAAQYGFRKVIGVEFSEPLCRVARRNWEVFSHRQKLESNVVVVHADVVDYAFHSDEIIFFLYDPFSSEVLTQVLDNLRRSVAANPRDIWLISNSPRYHELMVGCGLFNEDRRYVIGGSEFHVYKNARSPGGG